MKIARTPDFKGLPRTLMMAVQRKMMLNEGIDADCCRENAYVSYWRCDFTLLRFRERERVDEDRSKSLKDIAMMKLQQDCFGIDNNCFSLLCKCSGLLWIETKGIDHGKLQYAGLVMKKVMKMEATRLHFKHDKATQKAMMRINICTFNCISRFL
ncbi:unnamed protein product [Vicia faba]|uniref:Uncharacterized protein n=1 Tax=Vicia faba TaxID=3906 RepID=A0AAV1AGG8_VICFA|nr:unnamed protein product [Vicia faba]